jgi:hypothetical protein
MSDVDNHMAGWEAGYAAGFQAGIEAMADSSRQYQEGHAAGVIWGIMRAAKECETTEFTSRPPGAWYAVAIRAILDEPQEPPK